MNRLPIAFMDIFAILLINFLVLWVLAVLLIKPKEEETISQEPYQEFLVTVTWDAKENVDVDSWIMRQGDKNSLTGYARRENDVFILHNDNTSSHYGAIAGESLEIARETLSIEKIIPDTYHFSLHGYRINNEKRSVVARVDIVDLKPYRVIYSGELEVKPGIETPVVRWRINSDGNVEDITTENSLLRKIVGGFQ